MIARKVSTKLMSLYKYDIIAQLDTSQQCLKSTETIYLFVYLKPQTYTIKGQLYYNALSSSLAAHVREVR